jgi:hypothetical protein
MDEEEFRKIGMPGHMYLELFGSMVWDYFDHAPFLVGSALTGENPRDVDVRLMLDDDQYEHFCGPYVTPERTNPRWAAICMAFSELGRKLTGLPIDFQIQRRGEANEKYPGRRQALGWVSHRMVR